MAAREDRAGLQVRRNDQGRLRRRPRHHRPEAGAGRAGGARVAAARHHGRRAGARRLHRPRRALPLRQPHLPAVLRPDRGAGRRTAPARHRRPRHLPERAGDAGPGARGRVDRLRPAGAGRGRGAPVDDDPRGPRHGPVGRGPRRVRADERHPRPQAGAGSAARVGGRAAAHHGQRAGARRVHRRRVSLPLRQSTRRGVDGGEPPGGDRPAGRRDDGTAAIRAARAAARARARRRDGRHRIAAPPAERRPALGADPLRAQPRHRRQGHRHLRGAHRHPRGEAQRGSAAPRELDAVLAHQQHAAGGAGVGSGFPARPLVAPGGEHLRLARRRGAGDAAVRQSADPRVRPRGDRGDAGQARQRRGAARDRPDAQPPDRRRHDLVRVVSLVPARRRGTHRVDPLLRPGRELADPGRGAPAVHGDARRADGPAQPAAAARAAGAGDRAGAALGPARRRAVHRPRPLQERQRHAGPPDRRRAAAST